AANRQKRLSFVSGRRRALLEAMRDVDFEQLRASGVLEGVERLVVAEHHALFASVLGEPWSPPVAYRWIRYESPDPIGALLAAGDRLDALWREHRVGLQERMQLYGAAEEGELDRLEEVLASL
ncbi:MAG TPA: hypothetical protein VF134_06510, partial [Candidatus Dormibacteraeota bacterium]